MRRIRNDPGRLDGFASGSMFRVISYRLYCLKDGCIVSTDSFDAEDDVAAVKAAHARGNPVDCELWSDSRLVAFVRAAPDEG